MNKFITIHTFTYPIEMVSIRGRLEAEGIEYRVQDELTAQANPFYSNAIGGIKLQVRESDVEEAIELLKEGGYIRDVDQYPYELSNNLEKLSQGFDRLTSRIPFLNLLRPEFRFMAIVALLSALILAAFYFTSRPSPFARLTKYVWYVEKLTHLGEYYEANTNERSQPNIPGICNEYIDFGESGTISLPGFKTNRIWGEWKMKGSDIQILQTDTFNFVYKGLYEVEFSGNKLILKSEGTGIYCHAVTRGDGYSN